MLRAPLAIIVVLLGAIFFSLWMVNRYPWAEKFSAVLWIIFTSALASNLDLIPTETPIYDALVDFCVPFAVCVILFTVNLSDVRQAGRPMLAAFGLASLGTALGVLIASLTLEPFLVRILGAESWKLAGPFTGTYIGGSLNFFALWSGLDIGNPDLFAAANGVDNVAIFPLFTLWMVIPSILAGRYVVAKRWKVSPVGDEERPSSSEKPRLNTVHVVALFFLALFVITTSNWMKTAFVNRFFPSVPTILIVTTFALLLGQLRPIRRLEGAWEIGDLAFYVFFAAVGAMINFYQAVSLSPVLFLYVMIIIVIHMVVLYGVGQLLRMDPGVLTIASVATKSGPPVVAPVAEANGWRHLVLPGIIVGMLGYAVGNYAGYAVAHIIRLVLGG